MEDVLGASWIEFLLLTVVAFGGAAFMMGRALAETWRPAWQIIPYGLLLAVADRLFMNFFFAEDVLSVPGYIIAALVLTAIALLTHRLVKVNKVISQYPWLYERTHLFGWRKIG